MKLAVLEQMAVRAERLLQDPANDAQGVAACMRSLRDIGQASWKDLLEPLMVVDTVLREDPAEAYAEWIGKAGISIDTS